jgi:hypothetical protein
MTDEPRNCHRYRAGTRSATRPERRARPVSSAEARLACMPALHSHAAPAYSTRTLGQPVTYPLKTLPPAQHSWRSQLTPSVRGPQRNAITDAEPMVADAATPARWHTAAGSGSAGHHRWQLFRPDQGIVVNPRRPSRSPAGISAGLYAADRQDVRIDTCRNRL